MANIIIKIEKKDITEDGPSSDSIRQWLVAMGANDGKIGLK